MCVSGGWGEVQQRLRLQSRDKAWASRGKTPVRILCSLTETWDNVGQGLVSTPNLICGDTSPPQHGEPSAAWGAGN